MPKQRKWIRKELEALDPHIDYVKIWRLTSTYGLTDFMQNMMYSIVFPNFVVTEWGSEAIWRDDGGKVVNRPAHRAEQTGTINTVWWFYGPHDDRTKKSVDNINKLHSFWAKQYPGRFAYNEDYIYTCAFTAIAAHRMRLLMGAGGISEREKIAAHLFWLEMSKLFKSEGGVPVDNFPADFDGLMAFCEEFENTPRPKPERGNLITVALHEHFVVRYFPRPLHWLGHQFLRSMSLPTTLHTMQIDPPTRLASAILPRLLGLSMMYQQLIAADPPRSYIEDRDAMTPEERRRLRDEINRFDKGFPSHFVQRYKHDPKFAGCPFHAAMSDIGSDVSPEVSAIETNEGVLGRAT